MRQSDCERCAEGLGEIVRLPWIRVAFVVREPNTWNRVGRISQVSSWDGRKDETRDDEEVAVNCFLDNLAERESTGK